MSESTSDEGPKSAGLIRLEAMWAAAEEEALAEERGDYRAMRAATRKLRSLAMEDAAAYAESQIESARSHGRARALAHEARRLVEQACRALAAPTPKRPATPRAPVQPASASAWPSRPPQPRVRTPQPPRQPTVAALRGKKPVERCKALQGVPSRAQHRRNARAARAAGWRVIQATESGS